MISLPEEVLPQADVSERLLLGAMMLSGSVAADVRAVLGPDDFYVPAHQVIFRGLCDMAADCPEVSVGAVLAYFQAEGLLKSLGKPSEAEGQEYLVELAEGTPSAANALYDAGVVRDKSLKRKLILVGRDLTREAYTGQDSAVDLLGRFQEQAYDLEFQQQGTGSTRWSDLTAGVLSLSQSVERREASAGLLTGFPGIDRALGGFQPSDLITVGAGTSVGKTCFALAVCANILSKPANRGGIVFVSAEMDESALARRLLASRSGVPVWAIQQGELKPSDWEAVQLAKTAMDGWQLDFMHRSATVAEIKSRARQKATEWGNPLSLVVVDYLQLMRSDEKDIRQRINAITWGLKSMATDLRTPVLMLSQLNREAVKTGTLPALYHLKESGNVENDSNSVLLLHSPEEEDADTDGTPFIYLKVAKARDGMTTLWPKQGVLVKGSVKLRFKPEIQRMESTVI